MQATVNQAAAVDNAFANTTVQTLDALVERRKNWEANDYKKANEGLYQLLADCKELFDLKFVNATDADKKALRLELTSKLKADGVKVQTTTPTLTMFVRYIFGSDRKRAHGYAYVLKAAISHDISAKDLPAYIIGEGGIEEVKRKMVMKPETVAKREAVKAATSDVKSSLELAAATPLASIPLAGVKGTFAVLLTRPKPDGMLDVVGVVPDAKESLVEALIVMMAKHKLEDDANTAMVNKEFADMFADVAASNATAYVKQA